MELCWHRDIDKYIYTYDKNHSHAMAGVSQGIKNDKCKVIMVFQR